MTDIKKGSRKELIPVSIEGTKKILFQMENCICKIHLKNDKIEIGFLYKIPFHCNLLPVLILNNNVLNELDNNKIIKLTINNKEKKIKIDKSRKKYINPDKNFAIIEIKPNKDKIYNYFEIDENEVSNNKKYIDLEEYEKNLYILYIFQMKKLLYHMA